MSKTVKHTVRTDEVWMTRTGLIRKATVRVAKGDVNGNRPGTFQGATNLRGTVLGLVAGDRTSDIPAPRARVSLVKA